MGEFDMLNCAAVLSLSAINPIVHMCLGVLHAADVYHYFRADVRLSGECRRWMRRG